MRKVHQKLGIIDYSPPAFLTLVTIKAALTLLACYLQSTVGISHASYDSTACIH